MKKLVMPLLHGGCACTAVTPLEIFTSAGVIWNLLHGEAPEPCFEVTTVTVDGSAVRASAWLQLTPEKKASAVQRPDLVFVPAGGVELDVLSANGYDIDAVCAANAAIIPHLRRWARDGAEIAAACSGVALAAMAGVLDGRVATAHWGLAHLYKQRFPQIDWRPEYLVTDMGGVYCGGGINAAADLALYLVEKFAGRAVAVKTAKALLIEMPRTWQSAFADFALQEEYADSSIGAALAYLQRYYSKPISTLDLARVAKLAPRTFARRFKQVTGRTALAYLQSIRIDAAKRLLEDSRLSVKQIMRQTGYDDAIFFRNLFRRHTGETPGSYRERFGNLRTAFAPAARPQASAAAS